MRDKRSLKFRFEDSVFGDVFGNGVRVSSNGGFWANTPGGGGMVAKEFDIVFGRVIMYFGFDSEGGELGRRSRSEGPGKYLKV